MKQFWYLNGTWVRLISVTHQLLLMKLNSKLSDSIPRLLVWKFPPAIQFCPFHWCKNKIKNYFSIFFKVNFRLDFNILQLGLKHFLDYHCTWSMFVYHTIVEFSIHGVVVSHWCRLMFSSVWCRTNSNWRTAIKSKFILTKNTKELKDKEIKRTFHFW